MKPIPDDIIRAGALGCPDNVIYGDGQEFAAVPDICAELLVLRAAARATLHAETRDVALGWLRSLLPEVPHD